MIEVYHAILAKEYDGVIEYIYPRTTSDLVYYDDERTIYDMILEIDSIKLSKEKGKGLVTNDFTDFYKKKLDGIEYGANNFEIHSANNLVPGGFMIGYERTQYGYPIEIDEEYRMYCNTDYDDSALVHKDILVTDEHRGLMSKEDKKKLNDIEKNANLYILPVATDKILGGIKTGYEFNHNNFPVKINSSGDVYIQINWQDIELAPEYNTATQEKHGLLSATDKDKINSLDYYADNFIPPIANKYELGRVKVGFKDDEDRQNYSVKIDSEGRAYVHVPWFMGKINKVTQSHRGLMSKEDKIKLDSTSADIPNIPLSHNAAAHNAIYRGAKLELKDEDLLEKLEDFNDLYIGDYITKKINRHNMNLVIAGFNMDYEVTKNYGNNICMITNECFDKTEIIGDNMIYLGSNMQSSVIPKYIDMLINAFDGLNLAEFTENDYDGVTLTVHKNPRNPYTKTITKATILSEQEVFGCRIWSNNKDENSLYSNRILPLFMHNLSHKFANLPDDMKHNAAYWLRNIAYTEKHYCAYNPIDKGAYFYAPNTEKIYVRLKFYLAGNKIIVDNEE